MDRVFAPPFAAHEVFEHGDAVAIAWDPFGALHRGLKVAVELALAAVQHHRQIGANRLPVAVDVDGVLFEEREAFRHEHVREHGEIARVALTEDLPPFVATGVPVRRVAEQPPHPPAVRARVDEIDRGRDFAQHRENVRGRGPGPDDERK
jgi:hypothetical protein